MKRPLILLTVLGTLLVAATPAALAMSLGLQDLRFAGDLGPGSGILLILVPVYLVWLPATVAGLVWLLDRLGVHYAPRDGRRLPNRARQRRLRAGLRFLASRPSLGQNHEGQPRRPSFTRRDRESRG